jgi:hypothetical protein
MLKMLQVEIYKATISARLSYKRKDVTPCYYMGGMM